MIMIEEGSCRNDSDCDSVRQYCYHVSSQCVNYTLCSRYNRKEGEKPARNPSQCGPCLPGYAAEELGTGELATLCKKEKPQTNIPENGQPHNSWIIYGSVLGTLVFLSLVFFVCAILFRRRSRKCQNNDQESGSELFNITPSAPPMEGSPFIAREESACMPFNNNKSLKDKNRLVCAGMFKEPNWVRCNPNYEASLNDNDSNMNPINQSETAMLPANENTNTWAPVQLAQVTNRNSPPGIIEQIDNTANAALAERNNSSSSNSSGSDNTNNNNGSNNGSTPESNNTRDDRERARSSNILIAQINVNVLNHDY